MLCSLLSSLKSYIDISSLHSAFLHFIWLPYLYHQNTNSGYTLHCIHVFSSSTTSHGHYICILTHHVLWASWREINPKLIFVRYYLIDTNSTVYWITRWHWYLQFICNLPMLLLAWHLVLHYKLSTTTYVSITHVINSFKYNLILNIPDFITQYIGAFLYNTFCPFTLSPLILIRLCEHIHIYIINDVWIINLILIRPWPLIDIFFLSWPERVMRDP